MEISIQVLSSLEMGETESKNVGGRISDQSVPGLVPNVGTAAETAPISPMKIS